MNEFQRYLIEEFTDDYLAGQLPRREMLRRVVYLTGSVTAAAAVLTTLGCSPSSAPAVGANATATATATTPRPASAPAAQAAAAPSATPVVGPDATVTPDDPAITASAVQYPGKAGTLLGYLARPKHAGTFPGIIVIHENMGLAPHIQEVTRRIAKVGFVALAPDLVSRAGGTEKVGDQARIAGILGRAAPEDMTDDLLSSVAYLKTQQGVNAQKLGCFGFCFGGGYAYRLAVSSPDILATTPFYGIAPPLDQAPNLKGAIYAIYAENDPRIDAGIPALEAAMKANNKRFSYEIIPGTSHGFHRATDVPGQMQAAKVAWQKMVDFLTKELKS